MLTVPLVELGSDHRQVHGPLDDLVVMASLHEKHRHTLKNPVVRLYPAISG